MSRSAIPVRGGVRWTRYVGAWLAIGSSPGALVLGAQLAGSYGRLSALWLALGALLMAALLLAQGRLGLLPPRGHGQTFAELSRGYLPPAARTAVGLLIAAGMVGWVGFSVGIGGESLARVTGAPAAVCALGLGVLVAVLANLDVRRWNVVAVGTTVITLVLVPLLLLGVDRAEAPVTVSGVDGAQAVVVLAAFVGYVAVFMLRSPDFTAGIVRPSGLLICVAALILPALMLVLVGASLQLSGDSSTGASLAGVPGIRMAGLPVGDLLIVLAVLAPGVTSAFSGGLALQVFTGARPKVATSVIAGVGLVLGVLQFHRDLVDWLALLAGVGPPIGVPFWVEAARRRRGHRARLVPTWIWLPPAVAGAALIAVGVRAAPLVSLAAAGLLAGAWGLRDRGVVQGGE